MKSYRIRAVMAHLSFIVALLLWAFLLVPLVVLPAEAGGEVREAEVVRRTEPGTGVRQGVCSATEWKICLETESDNLSKWWEADYRVIVLTGGGGKRALISLLNSDVLGGLSLALKFAESGSNVECINAHFVNDAAEMPNGRIVVDNNKKTIKVVIPFTDKPIKADFRPIVALEFTEPPNFSESEEGIRLFSVGSVDPISADSVKKELPTEISLCSNYPNPFNPTTTISFTLPASSPFKLEIYNITGQLIRVYEGIGEPGLNVISWDSKDKTGNDVSSGVYFYKLTTGNFSEVRKMVLLK